ncbi:MAG: ParA family protein [Verrucomicrobiota bacterium]
MIRVSIASQKGGVGKTTVSLNVAYSLATRGHRILLLDTDPQGAIGLSLFTRSNERPGFFEALNSSNAELPTMILPTRVPSLSIFPAGRYEHFQNSPLAWDPDGRRARIRQILATLEQLPGMPFDMILIDTAGGTHSITGDVLWLSQYVLISEQVQPLGLRTLPQILHQLAELRVKQPPTQVLGILPTMVDAQSPTSQDVLRQLIEIVPPELLFRTHIPRDDIFLRASEHGVPLALLQKKPPPQAALFDQLAEEIEQRSGIRPNKHDERLTKLVD